MIDLQLRGPTAERAFQQILRAIGGEPLPPGMDGAAKDTMPVSLSAAAHQGLPTVSGCPASNGCPANAAPSPGVAHNIVLQPPVRLVHFSPQLMTDGDFAALPQPQRDLVLMQRRVETPDLVQWANRTLAESLSITDSVGRLRTDNQPVLDTASTPTLIDAEYARELGLVP
jgi:hypothetical protein